ncbi:hypothetical protein OD91_0651 [Lutibacter sp. Hel_I_33_5]|uniref:hypothetical protein n=1 Tax=Lutibacter sp. Hel_I_33_5 TaxID=1566289 RepID=UPI0011A5C256|nr:hypothetical protein [Lutibacter sp. Hel_I_33_5]TVZ55404.1 hypothetical protein OD91_0651 [Lutibacter sp. Hel_I_33_5]
MKIFKQVTANNIGLTPYPFKKELAMEAYLIENEEILILDKDNFTEVAVLDEEIALKKGRRNRDGRIDILTSYGAEYLSIIELKLNQIDESTLNQLESYLDQKEQILEIGNYWEADVKPKWIGVMVGTSISADLQERLNKGYKYKDIIPIAGIVLNRYRSTDNNIFVVSDTYFSYKYSEKDYSKFLYKNKVFNKARLVNEIVREYVDLNPTTTFSKLKEIFPKQIQGSFGVFDKLSRAEEIYNNWGHKRHYIKSTETIHLADGEIIATCNQWNPHNTSDFIDNAKKLGYNIEIK